MRIGIDFDNTLVCYDQLFWTLARDRGVVDESVPRRKDAVRDHLRTTGLESVWTTMQGEAYGPRILEATPFHGVCDAMKEFRRRDWTVFVVSHKTRVPIAGPKFDLHAAARSWLKGQGLLNPEHTVLSSERVYLELTKQDKLQRIAEIGCDCFIDDLPELLNDASFPSHVQRILFDPHRQFESLSGIRLLHDWDDVIPLLTAETIQ